MPYRSLKPVYYKELYNIFTYMHMRNGYTPITESWFDFDNFYKDLIDEYKCRIGYYPNAVMTLDRIDYNGIYEPSNCRIIPREAQASNKSDNTIVYLYNQRWTLSQIYRSFCIPGISYRTFLSRLEKGWEIHDALNVPSEVAYHKDKYFYTIKPIMDMTELYRLHTRSQFLDPRDKNELFNYDPRNIEDI